MLDHEDESYMKSYFDVCFGKVPDEELYNKDKDPDMIHNLADEPEYDNIVTELRLKLDAYLYKTKDPRSQGLSPWDNYNFDKPVGKVVENSN